MKTVTVTTEKELEEVLKNKNVDKIRVEGSLAHKMRSKAKKKKILAGSLLGASAIALGSIIAAPFTGGASLIAGATAAGLTATIGTATIVVSATELAILVGGALCSLAIMVGFKKITFNKDGSVIMEKG
jgi:CBS-domain-containing membrane protein